MAKCCYKIGLLSLRDCGEPTQRACIECGRPICRKHGEETGKGAVCLECKVKSSPGEHQDRAYHTYRRRRFYHGTDYYPYYYGHRTRYGHDDYRYFDPDQDQQAPPVDLPEEDDMMSSADFQDS